MFDTLSDDEKNQVTARAEQFEHALARGPVTHLAPFLDGLSGPARLVLLAELVGRDLRHRWANGERPTVESYLAQYPELGPANAVPVALILEEYRCRVRAGEPPGPLPFRDRFPAQFEALQMELQAAEVSGTIKATGTPNLPPQIHGTVEVAQQYELVRELGRGMFGEVWLARKKPSGIERAIKILLQAADRDAGQRELKSLELIKNLRHPYLLATEDFWVTNNRLHIVMELAEGTLRGLMRRYLSEGRPGVPADELFRYIAEAAEGLDFLHAEKIVHRDVKPDNILILHGHAKVADFGLARSQTQVVESMSLAGTPAYMAPEIWGGEGGAASDLYSLAFAYVELRQGQSPLKPCPFVELMLAHQEGRYDFTDTVTEPERAVLRRALSAKPHDRHPTCTDFVADLAHALGLPFAGGGHRIAGRSGAPPHPPIGAAFGSGGALTDDSPPPAVETGAGGGTVVIDSLRKKPRPAPDLEPVPEEPAPFAEPEEPDEPRRPMWPLLAGGTLALVALVVAGIALFVQGGGKVPSTEVAEERPTQPARPGTVPTEPDVKPKPPDPIQPPVGPVEPITPKWVFPAGTTPDPGAKPRPLGNNKTVPDWVFAERNGERVRFRLVTGQPGPPVAPFYISETKVTKKQYATGDDTPAVDLTAGEARAFAHRTYGGDLPTADEWDHAAGFHDQQGLVGPTQATGRAWIEQPAPGPVKRGENSDMNALGLHDMAGNGREWTRTVLGPFRDNKPGNRRDLDPKDQPAEGEKVILRGRNFAADRPLDFKSLELERDRQPRAATATVRSPYTGFRVVLKVP
ncbi:MAG TPA: protein kinase [Gemmata sp.]